MARPKLYDDALRERLLTLASEQVSRDGADAVTVRQLASAAGTSTGAVYSLFGGRSELMAQLHHSATLEFDRSQRAVPVTDDPAEDLLALAHAYRNWAIENPHWYLILFGGTITADLGENFNLQTLIGTIEPLQHAVQRVIDSTGSWVDARSMAVACWSVVHGYVALELQGIVPIPGMESTTRFNDMLIAALVGLGAGNTS